MKYVKIFEEWTEEKEEEFPHKDLYGMLEDLVNAWKEWKENEDEDKDEEELHDEFMRKVEDLVERAKDVVEDEEEEEGGGEEREDREEDMGSEDEGEYREDEDKEEEGGEEMKESRRDLSQDPRSLTGMLQPLIPIMNGMSFEELMDAFVGILNDPNLSASPTTIKTNIMRARNSRDKRDLMRLISNTYLRGSGLGTSLDDYK